MDGSPAPGFRQRPWWLLAVAAVTAGQAGLALSLFGPAGPVAAVRDPRPVVAGRHPLHLYHGALGAATFADRAATACYDPGFQAGCPKTPVFDPGCRPAELCLVLAGGDPFNPAAYKAGLVAVCCLAPVTVVAAARGLGAPPAGAALAGAGGCLVWWSPPARALLDAGHVDLLLAGLAGLLFVGGLARYAADPGPLSWALLTGAVAAGWFAHPLAWAGLAPVGAAYLVAVAPRHGLAWHLGLIGAGAAGLAPNLWWLADWARFWWLRQPGADDLPEAPGWAALAGTPADYAGLAGPGWVGWAVVAAGLGGLVGMARAGRRVEAGLVAVAAGCGVVGARVGADRAAPFALAVLVIPAGWLLARWWVATAAGRVATAAGVLLPAGVWWAGGAGALGLDLSPLPLGLSADQEHLVEGLTARTAADARILVEDADPGRPGWNWTALLPALTGRAFVGGLDPDAGVDPTFLGMRRGRLNGRPFADWTPADRGEFCRRYNVGWVLCRTPEAAAWWASDPAAKEVGRYRDGGPVTLFELARPRSFVLAGTATVERADRRRIVLTDVAPDAAGEVVLSFHRPPGVRAAPTVVGVDADADLFDPLPLVKLRLAGPVSRVTLTWDTP